MSELNQDRLRKIALLMNKNRLIDATKLYREWTGCGLEEAKEAVEQIHQAAQNAPSEFENWEEDVLELLKKGEKIKAVKLYRDAHRSSLKDAHDAILQMAKDNEIELPSGFGCAGVLIACFSLSWLLGNYGCLIIG